jgi:hypothetical protein
MVCTIPVWPFVVADGPYLEIRIHIGGLWIHDAVYMGAAVGWEGKAVRLQRIDRGALVPRNANRTDTPTTPTAEYRDSNEKAENHGTHLTGRRDPGLRR